MKRFNYIELAQILKKIAINKKYNHTIRLQEAIDFLEEYYYMVNINTLQEVSATELLDLGCNSECKKNSVYLDTINKETSDAIDKEIKVCFSNCCACFLFFDLNDIIFIEKKEIK